MIAREYSTQHVSAQGKGDSTCGMIAQLRLDPIAAGTDGSEKHYSSGQLAIMDHASNHEVLLKFTV